MKQVGGHSVRIPRVSRRHEMCLHGSKSLLGVAELGDLGVASHGLNPGRALSVDLLYPRPSTFGQLREPSWDRLRHRPFSGLPTRSPSGPRRVTSVRSPLEYSAQRKTWTGSVARTIRTCPYSTGPARSSERRSSPVTLCPKRETISLGQSPSVTSQGLASVASRMLRTNTNQWSGTTVCFSSIR